MVPDRHPKLISVIVPVFNEHQCLLALAEKLEAVFKEMKMAYEVVFVDDASTDGSFEVIRSLATLNPHFFGLRFSKNRGQQTALSAGFEWAKGDVVITMDADLQHPPDLIPQLVESWKQGFDIVNTVKLIPAPSFTKGLLSKWFYRIFNALSDDLKLVPGCSDFRLLDRKCVNALNQIQERLKFYRGLIEYVGFKQTSISFKPPPRLAGEAKFTFMKSLLMGMDALFSFSTTGLKVPFVLGLLILGGTFVYALVAVFMEFFTDYHVVRGWPSIIALSTLFFGAQFLFTGIIGLYVGKIFVELKRRPGYFIADSVNLQLPGDT